MISAYLCTSNPLDAIKLDECYENCAVSAIAKLI